MNLLRKEINHATRRWVKRKMLYHVENGKNFEGDTTKGYSSITNSKRLV